ncbi:MAG: universal stress protein [Acidobacteriota bacterium]|nr:universal stress protein [Acidobacteriota bacterium]
MRQFSHVLCPIDFSETSVRATTYARAFAHWYGATLTVLHVVPTSAAAIEPAVGLAEAERILLSTSQDDVLAELRRLPGPPVQDDRTSLIADSGVVHTTILRHASTLPADLLVMGTHGRSGFSRLFLGSVTARVVRNAPCPVLTVPPAPGTGTALPVVFKNILCGVDFSPASLAALKWALELGRQSGGRVTVLHAIEFLHDREPSPFLDVDLAKYHRDAIKRAGEWLHARLAGEPQTWCTIDEVVVVGRAAQLLLSRSADGGADLIVVGAQGAGGIELMLSGSTSQPVLRGATCPVLSVPA